MTGRIYLCPLDSPLVDPNPDCPQHELHTPQPRGYVEWFEWAAHMNYRGHSQRAALAAAGIRSGVVVAMTNRWGKAGVRLTPTQTAERNQRAVAGRARRDTARAESDRIAHQKWRMGLVIPAHITSALNKHDLYGPEVDIACGAREPDVDLWEAGKLYPRWEQILLLGELTHTRPIRFMAPITTLSVYDTSLRFHLHPGEREPLPVHQFTHAALVRARKFGVEALVGLEAT